MTGSNSKAALAALVLLCSAVGSARAQYAVSFAFVAGSSTGLTGAALTCAQGGGNALFSSSGALRRGGGLSVLCCLACVRPSSRRRLRVDDSASL
jgi:hypothetical protein